MAYKLESKGNKFTATVVHKVSFRIQQKFIFTYFKQ